MTLNSQKRIAAQILKVGKNRVYMNPERREDISSAITREDIRALINEGVISARPEQGSSRGRIKQKNLQKKKGRRKGHGSRKGTKKSRNPKKEEWINKIRTIRNELKKLRKEGKIEKKEYRELYRQSKGGLFQSKRHLKEYIKKIKK